MSTFATPIPKGKTSPAGFLRILGKIFTGSGVVEADALKVSAQDTPDMSVVVSGSALNDNAVLIHTDGTFIHIWNDQDETVAIPANATGVTKTDALVAYVDLAVNDDVPLEDLTPNNQDALKFKVIRRGSTLTGNPTSSEITADADVGSNPYLVLAYVTVGAGVGSSPGDAINSGNITDARTRAQIEADRLETIGTNQIENGAVTQPKAPFALSGDEANLLIDSARVNFVPLAASGTRTDTITFSDLSTIKYINVILLRGSGGNDTAGKIEWTVLNGADSPWEVNPSGNSTQIFWRNPTGTAIYGFAIVWAIGEKA